ncbi:MAG: DUF1772 domain-containing protein [Chitinophagaceae bacterium]|nr:DUF1772 domain-containing protein [Chitinophagaceae bacterium]
MPVIYKLAILSTCFLTALITGLFYSYSCSVNTGLNRLGDTEYLRAMQSINRAILNPVFFASFIGTLILLPVCTWTIYKNEAASMSFYFLLTAALIYGIGVFGVTVFGNVPLNEILDKFDIGSSTTQEMKSQRLAFESPWNKLHFVRTIACLFSLLLTLASVVIRL